MYPVLEDVLQFERLVAKLLAGFFRIILIELYYLTLQRRVYLNILVCACAVFQSAPGDGYAG